MQLAFRITQIQKGMTHLNMYQQIETLVANYEALIQEANSLENVNPEAKAEKLKSASQIMAQIEELKIAKNN